MGLLRYPLKQLAIRVVCAAVALGMLGLTACVQATPTPGLTLQATPAPLSEAGVYADPDVNLHPEVVAEYTEIVGPEGCTTTFSGGIPGIGGIFGRGGERSGIYLYLMDPYSEEVTRSVFCVYADWDVTVRLLQAQYTLTQLQQWSRQIWEELSDVPETASVRTLVPRNRVEVELTLSRGTIRKLDAVLERLDIPKEAIIVDHPAKPEMPVSGPDIQMALTLRPRMVETLRLSLDVPSQVAYGETVWPRLTVTNVGDQTAQMVLIGRREDGYRWSGRFVVASADGTPLWTSEVFDDVFDAYVVLRIRGTWLAPWGQLSFTGTWEQVDYLGYEVPPGTYQVYGIFYFNVVIGTERQQRGILKTGPVVMTVLEP